MVDQSVLRILHQFLGRWLLALRKQRSLLDDGRNLILSGDNRLTIFKAHELLDVLELLVGDLGLSELQLVIVLDLLHDFRFRLGVHCIYCFQSLRKILLLELSHPFGIEGPLFLLFLVSAFLLDLLQRDVCLK